MEIRQAITLTPQQLTRLRTARQRSGQTLVALGAELGVTHAMVSMVLAGKRPAPLDLLTHLCRLLGLDCRATLAVEITPKKKRKSS